MNVCFIIIIIDLVFVADYCFSMQLRWFFINQLHVEENVLNLLVAAAMVQETISDWKCVLCRNIWIWNRL